MRRLLIYALAYVALFGSAVAFLAPDAPQDTPPSSTASEIARLQRVIQSLEKKIEAMEQTADRYAKWKTCVSWVSVNEVGDPDNTFGFGYDQKDGTGPTFMPALAVDQADERPDYVFLKFARRDDCHSQPVQPGGTAEDASLDAPDAVQTTLAASPSSNVRMLEKKVKQLQERAKALERMSERFDEWESCLSWVPVTEYGNPDGRFGYLYSEGGGEPGYRAAIAVDGSEWDDPDYEFLAFAGRDRPFTNRECQGEPGEGVD
jgi:hypothetical protein